MALSLNKCDFLSALFARWKNHATSAKAFTLSVSVKVLEIPVQRILKIKRKYEFCFLGERKTELSEVQLV